MQRIALAAAGLFAFIFLAAGCGSHSPPPAPAIIDVNGGLNGSGTAGSLLVVDGTGF